MHCEQAFRQRRHKFRHQSLETERLDLSHPSVEDGVQAIMKISTLLPGCIALVALGTVAVCASAQDAKNPAADGKATAQQAQNAPVLKLTIVVTGGEKNVPVENASVYLKYVEERKIKKDKVTELNVKTNRDGTAHIPEPQLGRV